MSHLDEGTLHALMDGELATTEVAEIQAHLGSCSACGLRLREVKEFLAESDLLIASMDLVAEPRAYAPPTAPTPTAPPPVASWVEPAVAAAAPEQAEVEPEAELEAELRPEPPAPRPAPPPRAAPPPRPESPARAKPRPRPEPPAPPPAAAPASPERWNEPPPPVFLVPDNESAAERRMRLWRRLSWAAMIAVVIGATYLFRRGHLPPPSSQMADTAPVAANAVVSPEETARPSAQQPAPKAPAGRADNVPQAAKPSPAPVLPAPVVKEKAIDKTADAGVGKSEADSAVTEDIETVRARGAEALAELDRERLRDRAAEATAALDAAKRRRAAVPPAGAVAARAQPVPAPAPAAPVEPPTREQRAQVYLRIGLDEAARQLGGPAHVIEGMSPLFMGLAQGAVVSGADAARPVVRVVYQDAQGRLIMLDQQRLQPGQSAPPASPVAWTLGQTALWLDGEAPPDILRSYRPRVR